MAVTPYLNYSLTLTTDSLILNKDCRIFAVTVDSRRRGQSTVDANAMRKLTKLFLFSVATIAVIFGTVLLAVGLWSWIQSEPEGVVMDRRIDDDERMRNVKPTPMPMPFLDRRVDHDPNVYWTDERIRNAKPMPMPVLEPEELHPCFLPPCPPRSAESAPPDQRMRGIANPSPLPPAHHRLTAKTRETN